MPQTVLVISTLDTKGAETRYLKEKTEAIGLQTLVMDLSMGGEGTWAGATWQAPWMKRVKGRALSAVRGRSRLPAARRGAAPTPSPMRRRSFRSVTR